MIRFLWQRLGESSDARLSRIRRFGFIRFSAIYILVFPLCHAVMAAVRATAIGNPEPLSRLPVEMAGWAAAGLAVATLVWTIGRRSQLRAVPSRRATPDASSR
jgi:hypothetical protein